MRQIKMLFCATLALTFLGGMGTGAWIGTLRAQTVEPQAGVDRRADEFASYFDLDPTQMRQVKTILHEHDQQKQEIRQLTAEQFRRTQALEEGTRRRIRDLLTERQRRIYDKLNERR